MKAGVQGFPSSRFSLLSTRQTNLKLGSWAPFWALEDMALNLPMVEINKWKSLPCSCHCYKCQIIKWAASPPSCSFELTVYDICALYQRERQVLGRSLKPVHLESFLRRWANALPRQKLGDALSCLKRGTQGSATSAPCCLLFWVNWWLDVPSVMSPLLKMVTFPIRANTRSPYLLKEGKMSHLRIPRRSYPSLIWSQLLSLLFTSFLHGATLLLSIKGFLYRRGGWRELVVHFPSLAKWWPVDSSCLQNCSY